MMIHKITPAVALSSRETALCCLKKKYEWLSSRMQGSKGIRQWQLNGCTSPIMIHKITPSVDQN